LPAARSSALSKRTDAHACATAIWSRLRLTATVERTRFHVGDAIAAGDVIAILHPLPSSLLDAGLRAELEQRASAADAALGRARTVLGRSTATLEHANAELARARELLQKGDPSGRAERRARCENRGGGARRSSVCVHVGEHELEVARTVLGVATRAKTSRERFAIESPIAGRILRIAQERESAVGSGTPLIELGDPSVIDVVVDLLSTDAVQIEPGDEASIPDGRTRGGRRTRAPHRHGCRGAHVPEPLIWRPDEIGRPVSGGDRGDG
jgi:HlyD family secretion protein